jgi:hypothetical protein
MFLASLMTGDWAGPPPVASYVDYVSDVPLPASTVPSSLVPAPTWVPPTSPPSVSVPSLLDGLIAEVNPPAPIPVVGISSPTFMPAAPIPTASDPRPTLQSLVINQPSSTAFVPALPATVGPDAGIPSALLGLSPLALALGAAALLFLFD